MVTKKNDSCCTVSSKCALRFRTSLVSSCSTRVSFNANIILSAIYHNRNINGSETVDRFSDQMHTRKFSRKVVNEHLPLAIANVICVGHDESSGSDGASVSKGFLILLLLIWRHPTLILCFTDEKVFTFTDGCTF